MRSLESFRKLVAYGLAHRRLAVKFLFGPGSTVFINDQKISGQYKMWLEQIAREAAASDLCLEVTGHTTPTGLPPMNNRLSLLRAEYVKDRLDTMEPQLTPRTIANGVGSRENLVGTGKDDESDALDRRVEFKVLGSACGKAAEELGGRLIRTNCPLAPDERTRLMRASAALLRQPEA